MTSLLHRRTPETPATTAIEELYRAHFDTLVRTAKRLLDTQHLAEEAVQEAFLRFQTSGATPAEGAQLAYLRVAVLNNARSMLRRRQCAERWRPEIPRYEPPVDELCVNAALGRVLRNRCELLPERQRQVLVLRYWHGLSVGETADRLAISAGSVKTHSSRGRQALRLLLTEQVA